MGKGDKKSAKGKRVMGSYGNTRPRVSNLPKKEAEKK
jgi:ribosomal small subunit protein bTHX